MSAADWFCTSTINWFRQDPGDVLNNIAARINPEPISPGHIFRPDQLQNATTQRIVPTAAERLIRWDRRGYRAIFQSGFSPRVRPDPGTFPDEAFNLRSYILSNTPSVFVSTARYYREDNTNALRRWRARNIHASTYYEYEIFAYGGINVNDVLGPHVFERQHEIAFPGGISPSFIRSVRIYEGQNPIQIVQNPRFNNLVNPSLHVVALTDLPGPVIMRGLEIEYYPPENPDDAGAPHGRDELRRRRDVAFDNASEDWDDLMRGDGDGFTDPLIQSVLSRPGVAAVLHSSGGGRAYFFCWNMYVAINIAPESTNDTIAWGPKTLVDSWPSLVEAKFGHIDAVLPNPDNIQQMYFFFREQYALIDTKPGTTEDRLISGPKTIYNGWPSLKQAGFNTVDAVLPSAANKYEVYVFSGESYVLIHFEPGRANDYIINGPKLIVTEWPSLRKAGFKTVDTILPHPNDPKKAYVFSGDKYVLIYFSPGAVDDYILNGPKLVRTEWPSLHKAEFY